jgi:hypothetical protein
VLEVDFIGEFQPRWSKYVRIRVEMEVSKPYGQVFSFQGKISVMCGLDSNLKGCRLCVISVEFLIMKVQAVTEWPRFLPIRLAICS